MMIILGVAFEVLRVNQGIIGIHFFVILHDGQRIRLSLLKLTTLVLWSLARHYNSFQILIFAPLRMNAPFNLIPLWHY